jgi:hypothetical protein
MHPKFRVALKCQDELNNWFSIGYGEKRILSGWRRKFRKFGGNWREIMGDAAVGALASTGTRLTATAKTPRPGRHPWRHPPVTRPPSIIGIIVLHAVYFQEIWQRLIVQPRISRQ